MFPHHRSSIKVAVASASYPHTCLLSWLMFKYSQTTDDGVLLWFRRTYEHEQTNLFIYKCWSKQNVF